MKLYYIESRSSVIPVGLSANANAPFASAFVLRHQQQLAARTSSAQSLANQ